MEYIIMILIFIRKLGIYFKVVFVKYGLSVNKVKNVDMLNYYLYNWEWVNCFDWYRLVFVNVLYRILWLIEISECWRNWLNDLVCCIM